MAYLVFDTEQEADNRSRSAWEAVLGRPKNPKDVTEFLWGRSQPGLDGKVAVNIPDDMSAWGVATEQAALAAPSDIELSTEVATLDTANWPATAAAIDPIKEQLIK